MTEPSSGANTESSVSIIEQCEETTHKLERIRLLPTEERHAARMALGARTLELSLSEPGLSTNVCITRSMGLVSPQPNVQPRIIEYLLYELQKRP